MANYQNIQSYSGLVHLAAQYGGPEMLKKHLLVIGYQEGFQKGMQAQRATEIWKIPLALISGAVIYKACDFAISKSKECQEKKTSQQGSSGDKKQKLGDKPKKGCPRAAAETE